ncbi:protein rolling stone-like [Anticarsia gemmatalis]|uniref:protein rolling stone-like n=1 Tax=Anticarsia gemmatalis TaxID=129554 RepID=UPI003F75F409
MGAKRYFKNEFQTEKFFLEHDNAADFYLSCWQRNRSTLPLLFIRTILFVGCIAIWCSSMVLTAQMFDIGLWFIFLTHWGLMFNTAATGFAWAVSVRAFIRGPIDASIGLPWYVKAYWVMFNMAIPVAFFITLFYWAMLTELSVDYAMDPVLDVFIHGINSVVMFVLAVTARHPTRFLHFYFSIGIGLVYLVFTLIFHFAGGLSPFGTSWIYPMLDWDKPGPTMLVVVGSALGLIIMHCILVGITAGRDRLTRRFRDTNSLPISSDERYN